MTRLLQACKAVLLTTALAILAFAAFDVPQAAQATDCAGYGHTCHAALPDGTIVHKKEVAAY